MSLNPYIRRPGWIHTTQLRVPIYLALGHFERLKDEELNDHYWDIRHECLRRGLDVGAPPNGTTLFA